MGFVFASSLGILTPQGRLGRCWYRGRESGALSASTGLLSSPQIPVAIPRLRTPSPNPSSRLDEKHPRALLCQAVLLVFGFSSLLSSPCRQAALPTPLRGESWVAGCSLGLGGHISPCSPSCAWAFAGMSQAAANLGEISIIRAGKGGEGRQPGCYGCRRAGLGARLPGAARGRARLAQLGASTASQHGWAGGPAPPSSQPQPPRGAGCSPGGTSPSSSPKTKQKPHPRTALTRGGACGCLEMTPWDFCRSNTHVGARWWFQVRFV